MNILPYLSASSTSLTRQMLWRGFRLKKLIVTYLVKEIPTDRRTQRLLANRGFEGTYPPPSGMNMKAVLLEKCVRVMNFEVPWHVSWITKYFWADYGRPSVFTWVRYQDFCRAACHCVLRCTSLIPWRMSCVWYWHHKYTARTSPHNIIAHWNPVGRFKGKVGEIKLVSSIELQRLLGSFYPSSSRNRTSKSSLSVSQTHLKSGVLIRGSGIHCPWTTRCYFTQ